MPDPSRASDSSEDLTRRFTDALHHLEQTGEPEPLVHLFSNGASLSNPLATYQEGTVDDIKAFWRNYRASFETVDTHFRNAVEQGRVSFLEWTSEGTAKGQSFRYGGVTVIEHASGRIEALRSYFQPPHLTQPISGQEQDSDRLEQEQRDAAEGRASGGYQ